MKTRKQECRILRCAKKGTDKPLRNKPQERSKAVTEQTRKPNKKHNQRTVESHRSRVEQNQGDNREPEHATWREHGYSHGHGNLHTTRRQRQRHGAHKTHEFRHGAQCSLRRNQILGEIKKLEGRPKKGPNHPQKRDKRVAQKTANNTKDTNSELWNLIAAESDRIRRQGATHHKHRHGKRNTTGPQRQGFHLCRKCRHATNRSQTQESNFGRHQEIQSNEFPGRFHGSQLQGGIAGKAQDGTRVGAARSTAAEKHLRPKGERSDDAQAGVEQQHGKDSERDGHETGARERNHLYQETAGGSGGRTSKLPSGSLTSSRARHQSSQSSILGLPRRAGPSQDKRAAVRTPHERDTGSHYAKSTAIRHERIESMVLSPWNSARTR